MVSHEVSAYFDIDANAAGELSLSLTLTGLINPVEDNIMKEHCGKFSWDP